MRIISNIQYMKWIFWHFLILFGIVVERENMAIINYYSFYFDLNSFHLWPLIHFYHTFRLVLIFGYYYADILSHQLEYHMMKIRLWKKMKKLPVHILINLCAVDRERVIKREWVVFRQHCAWFVHPGRC